MSVNNTGNLLPVFDTSVKFYASLTRALALGTSPIGMDELGSAIFVEPGAVCFVSDSSGNSLILNKRIFGDGAQHGGGGEIIDLKLENIPVVTTIDGEVLKTLADYFNANGDFITQNLLIKSNDGDNVISITPSGILIGESYVATLAWTGLLLQLAEQTILAESLQQANTAESNAKAYADSLIVSVYKLKGSISSLNLVVDPKPGDVYNLTSTGMNYVYTEDGQWDALGGTVDVSNFYTKSEVNSAILNALTDAKNYTDGQLNGLEELIGANSQAITNLSTSVSNNSAQIVSLTGDNLTNKTNISRNTTNITNIATQLTWQ